MKKTIRPIIILIQFDHRAGAKFKGISEIQDVKLKDEINEQYSDVMSIANKQSKIMGILYIVLGVYFLLSPFETWMAAKELEMNDYGLVVLSLVFIGAGINNILELFKVPGKKK